MPGTSPPGARHRPAGEHQLSPTSLRALAFGSAVPSSTDGGGQRDRRPDRLVSVRSEQVRSLLHGLDLGLDAEPPFVPRRGGRALRASGYGSAAAGLHRSQTLFAAADVGRSSARRRAPRGVADLRPADVAARQQRHVARQTLRPMAVRATEKQRKQNGGPLGRASVSCVIVRGLADEFNFRPRSCSESVSFRSPSFSVIVSLKLRPAASLRVGVTVPRLPLRVRPLCSWFTGRFRRRVAVCAPLMRSRARQGGGRSRCNGGAAPMAVAAMRRCRGR